MYKQIESKIIMCGISKQELADKLGIGYNTLLLKLKGERCFTLDEALMTKSLINATESIEELFMNQHKLHSAITEINQIT